MRKIINSTYVTLDGIIGDPQDWPGNGIEDELAGTLALNTGTVILTYRVPPVS
jgi:hypothetical protein